MALHITEQNFEAEVLNSDIPVMVDFYANWCGPCKMMAPVVDKLSEELAGSMKICKVDVDDASGLAVRYRVMNIPSFLFFKNGELVDTVVGGMSAEALRQKCMQYL